MKKMLVRLLSTILAVMLTVNTPILSVFAEDSGSNTSGDLARFLQSLTIETMDGKTVTKEDLEIGDQYQVSQPCIKHDGFIVPQSLRNCSRC